MRINRKSRILRHKVYKSVNIVSMLSLVFYTSMIGVFFVPNNIAEATPPPGAGGGAIWTTNATCVKPASPQDVNEYSVNDWVYIGGDNFSLVDHN